MSLPKVETVRRRIESVGREDYRIFLKCAYLFAARVSELVAYASPRDTTIPRGPTGRDYYIDNFTLGPLKAEAAIFKIKTAKRGGKERLIALPLDKRFEPWTESILRYYQKCGDKPLFPFSRQRALQIARQVFKGLKYPVERYVIVNQSLGLRKVVEPHLKPFGLHALRHLRATELIEFYGFDGIDLSIFGGWTLRSMIGVGGSLERYAHLQWQKYFPKLLKERSF
ncbi:MAG: hypothetical protein QW791_08275 [Candidatus Bathyarchaeia archaeon]